MVAGINMMVESDDPPTERKRLEGLYGKVWDTSELSKDLDVIGFAAPYVVVVERDTGRKGTLEFQHSPRFYFNFLAA
jgi:hypothetical protein